MNKYKVLYIEDEPYLGRIVKDTLQQHFEVLWIADGAKVMEAFNDFTPDICVVDIMLPNVDGYTLCKQIKSKFNQMPLIFLTAKTETNDLVKGFEAGGTDYVRKPFSMEELVVRIKSQIKQNENKAVSNIIKDEEIQFGKYKLSLSRYELLTPSKTIKLSMRDMQILQKFVNAINQVVDRKELLLEIWGDDSFFNSRNLDVYIRKLREYLAEDTSIELVTLKGKGYLFLIS